MSTKLHAEYLPNASCNQECEDCDRGSHQCENLTACCCTHFSWSDPSQSGAAESAARRRIADKRTRHRRARISVLTHQLELDFDKAFQRRESAVAPAATGHPEKQSIKCEYIIRVSIDIQPVAR